MCLWCLLKMQKGDFHYFLVSTYYFFYLECHYCSVEKDFCELGVELSTVRYRPLTLLPQSSESESWTLFPFQKLNFLDKIGDDLTMRMSKRFFFWVLLLLYQWLFFQKNNRWCLRVAADTNKTSITAFCLEVSSISIGIVWLTI